MSTPSQVPLPLMNKVKQELQKTEEKQIIVPVVEPTQWCALVVVVSKPFNQVRICVDLTHLNKNIRREFYPISTLDYLLGQLKTATVFNKLNASGGYWQTRLAEESSFLTTFITAFGRFRFKKLCFGI